MKQSMSSSVQYRRVDHNDIVNRLSSSDYEKPAIQRMLKTSWNGLRPGLPVYGMDKVEHFRVTFNCISDKLSIIKSESVYPCRETILSMVTKKLPD